MMSQSPTDFKIQLGELLADLRKQAGLDREDAAKALRCSVSAISTYEIGRSAPGPTQLPVLLELYRTPDAHRPDILALGEAARKRRRRSEHGSLIPTRLRKFFDIEASARELDHYHPEFLHGLVQTEDYARAIIGENQQLNQAEVNKLVQARMARQALLGGASPLQLKLVVPEAVLRVVVGDEDVMRGQLQHLIRLINDGMADIRVVTPTAGVYASRGNKYTIIRARASNRRTVVYLDNLTDGVWVDDEVRVEEYQRAFDEVYRKALPPDETVALLARVMSEQ